MIGEVIGNYRVVAELGKGGMGVVYRAEHTQLGRPAALKMLLPQFSSDQGIVQRFFNEARAASAIDHPGIVEIYDFGTHTDGRAYIVMEMLKGESLEHRLVSGPVSPHDGATILAQTAAALGAAHQRGIVHRDLKPDNIFLVPNELVPGGLQVKLLDFGIAKLADEKTAGFKTQTGALMGTPAYMSPEQCMGKADLDFRTDIYSLGCILFHVLCGRPPFTSDQGTGMMIAAHIRDAAPDPRTVNPSVPPELAAIILRCLEKEPSARYQSAAELRNALVQAGANAPLSKPPVQAATTGYEATIAPGMSPQSQAFGSAPTAAPPMHSLGTAPTTLGGSAAQMTPAATVPPAKKGKGGLIAIIGGVAVLAAAGVGVAVMKSGEKKTDVVAAKGSAMPLEGSAAAPVVTPDAAVAPLPAGEAEKPASEATEGTADLKKVECTDGKVTNVDTRGHCCWADQVWSEAKSKCLGTPTCPPGMKLRSGTDECNAIVAAGVKPAPHGTTHPVVGANPPAASVPIFTVDAKAYGPNDSVKITFGHPVSSKSGAQAWVTISDRGAAETSYGNWEFVTDGATTAELKAPKRPGDYEVRVHTDYPTQSYNVRYRVPIAVKGGKQDAIATDVDVSTTTDTPIKPTPNPQTPLDKQTFSLARKKVKVGGEAVLHFPQPLHAADNEQFWITIVAKDAPLDKYDAYEYVQQDAKTAKIAVPSTPGDYEVRLHANYPTKSTNVVHRARLHVE